MLNTVNRECRWQSADSQRATYVGDSKGEATSWPGVASGLL